MAFLDKMAKVTLWTFLGAVDFALAAFLTFKLFQQFFFWGPVAFLILIFLLFLVYFYSRKSSVPGLNFFGCWLFSHFLRYGHNDQLKKEKNGRFNRIIFNRWPFRFFGSILKRVVLIFGDAEETAKIVFNHSKFFGLMPARRLQRYHSFEKVKEEYFKEYLAVLKIKQRQTKVFSFSALGSVFLAAVIAGLLSSFLTPVFSSLNAQTVNCVTPAAGMVIRADTKLCAGIHNLAGGGLYLKAYTLKPEGVTLDCNGAELVGVQKPDTAAIDAEGSSREKITIKNCRLKNWQYGVAVDAKFQISLINNTIEDCRKGFYLRSVYRGAWFSFTDNKFYANGIGAEMVPAYDGFPDAAYAVYLDRNEFCRNSAGGFKPVSSRKFTLASDTGNKCDGQMFRSGLYACTSCNGLDRCQSMGGRICTADQLCDRATVLAGDTETCCLGVCGPKFFCGNGQCDGGENYQTCSGDCPKASCVFKNQTENVNSDGDIEWRVSYANFAYNASGHNASACGGGARADYWNIGCTTGGSGECYWLCRDYASDAVPVIKLLDGDKAVECANNGAKAVITYPACQITTPIKNIARSDGVYWSISYSGFNGIPVGAWGSFCGGGAQGRYNDIGCDGGVCSWWCYGYQSSDRPNVVLDFAGQNVTCDKGSAAVTISNAENTTCVQAGGQFCPFGRVCQGNSFVDSSNEVCCLGECVKKADGDFCYVDSECAGGKCLNNACASQTCAQMGGAVCTGGKICDETTTSASDTNSCCLGECLAANICGNGVREMIEQCDDGNLLSGDGCSVSCSLEPVIIIDTDPCAQRLCQSVMPPVCARDQVLTSRTDECRCVSFTCASRCHACSDALVPDCPNGKVFARWDECGCRVYKCLFVCTDDGDCVAGSCVNGGCEEKLRVTAESGDRRITLRWSPSLSALGYHGVVINRSPCGSGDKFAIKLTEGERVYDGNGESLIDSGLVNGVRYCYGLFAYKNNNGNFSYLSPTYIQATPLCAVSSAENLSLASGADGISLSWTGGRDDYRWEIIKESQFGRSAYFLTGRSFVDGVVADGEEYVYAVSANDGYCRSASVSGRIIYQQSTSTDDGDEPPDDDNDDTDDNPATTTPPFVKKENLPASFYDYHSQGVALSLDQSDNVNVLVNSTLTVSVQSGDFEQTVSGVTLWLDGENYDFIEQSGVYTTTIGPFSSAVIKPLKIVATYDDYSYRETYAFVSVWPLGLVYLKPSASSSTPLLSAVELSFYDAAGKLVGGIGPDDLSANIGWEYGLTVDNGRYRLVVNQDNQEKMNQSFAVENNIINRHVILAAGQLENAVTILESVELVENEINPPSLSPPAKTIEVKLKDKILSRQFWRASVAPLTLFGRLLKWLSKLFHWLDSQMDQIWPSRADREILAILFLNLSILIILKLLWEKR